MTEELLRRLASAAADVSVVPGDDFARGVRRRARTLARRRTATRAGLVAGVVAVGGGAGTLALGGCGAGRVATIAPADPRPMAYPSAQLASDRATVLAALDDRELATAPYWYTALHADYPLDDLDETAPRVDEWLARNGITRQLQGTYVDALGTQGFPAYAGKPLTWDALASLPTDPTDVVGSLADLTRLLTLPLPSAQRAAVVGAVAALPGVRDLGDVRDSEGRAAHGLERAGEARLLLSADGHVLEDVGLDAEGRVDRRWTYLVQGPVQSLTQRLPAAAPSPLATAPVVPIPTEVPCPSPSPLSGEPGAVASLRAALDTCSGRPSPASTPSPVIVDGVPLPPGVSAGPPSPCPAALATLARYPAPAPSPLECRPLTRTTPRPAVPAATATPAH